MYLKIVGKQGQDKIKIISKEILRIGAKINEIQARRVIQRINETQTWLFK